LSLDTAGLPLFLAASTALLVTPGPDTAFVIATGIGRGRRPAVFGALGISLSMFSHSVMAAAGLSAFFAAAPAAFDAVRYAGTAYLLWLALSALLTGRVRTPAVAPGGTGLQSLRQGFLTNLLNPKVILFISVFLVQFTVPGHGPLFMQMVSLGAVLSLMSSAFFTGLGYLSGSLGRSIPDTPALRRVFPVLLALVFLVLAVNLFVMERPS
jgi:threonine/homoserine/homoserine lactone efflux protein